MLGSTHLRVATHLLRKLAKMRAKVSFCWAASAAIPVALTPATPLIGMIVGLQLHLLCVESLPA